MKHYHTWISLQPNEPWLRLLQLKIILKRLRIIVNWSLARQLATKSKQDWITRCAVQQAWKGTSASIRLLLIVHSMITEFLARQYTSAFLANLVFSVRAISYTLFSVGLISHHLKQSYLTYFLSHVTLCWAGEYLSFFTTNKPLSIIKQSYKQSLLFAPHSCHVSSESRAARVFRAIVRLLPKVGTSRN